MLLGRVIKSLQSAFLGFAGVSIAIAALTTLGSEPASAQCTINPQFTVPCFELNVPANSPSVYCHQFNITPVSPAFGSTTEYSILNSVVGIPTWATLVSINQATRTEGASVVFSLDTSQLSPGCNTATATYNTTEILDPVPNPDGCVQSGYILSGTACIMNLTSTLPTFQVYVSTSTAVMLVDPVPDLVSGNSVRTSSQLESLRTRGRVVSGVAADGVTQVVVRVQTTSPGHQFAVTLLNDQGTSSLSVSEDGALGNPGDTSFSQNAVTLTSGSLEPEGLAYAFAVYRAPLDFARPTGTGFKSGVCNGSSRTDDLLECRSVTVQVQDITANTAPISIPLTVIRPPVTMIHGLWANASAWDSFFPLVTSANGSDLRFSLIRVSYDDIIGNQITASDPPYPQNLLARAQNNSLGLDWNASSVLSRVKVGIGDFKNGNNAVGIPVAAIQSDVVGHSMGGLIARNLVLHAGFLNDNLNPSFGQGFIHKLITIDSPHLGSALATRILQPDERGGCLQHLLAGKHMFAFNTVTINGFGTFSGAVGDLVDNPMSGALNAIANNSPHPLPTSLIVGIYTKWSDLDIVANWPTVIQNWPFGCPSDPLAQQLTSTGWQQLFANQPNDGIVSETSQLNNLIPSPGSQFANYVHSPNTEKLGFSGPSVMDSGNVPQQVIFLLNTPATNTVYYNALNP